MHFGAYLLGLDGVAPDDPGVFVLHHFLGSWKVGAAAFYMCPSCAQCP